MDLDLSSKCYGSVVLGRATSIDTVCIKSEISLLEVAQIFFPVSLRVRIICCLTIYLFSVIRAQNSSNGRDIKKIKSNINTNKQICMIYHKEQRSPRFRKSISQLTLVFEKKRTMQIHETAHDLTRRTNCPN